MVDGVIASEAPVSDRGSAYGHGLFETMLLHNGGVPLWRQHCARDSPILGIAVSQQQLQESLDALIAALDNSNLSAGIIKLTVTAGSGGRGYQSPEVITPRIIAQYFALPEDIDSQRQRGIRLTECIYRLPANPMLAGIKHLNRLDQVLARAEWGSDQPYDDGIMFSCEGLVIETTRANLFLKTPRGWITPKLDRAGVRGVMRELLLDKLFTQCGLQAAEADIDRELLGAASELFVSSAIRGVVAVTFTPTTGELIPGADTQLVQQALNNSYPGFPC
jgi:4-amino-4-deoxychorismate lyase